MKIAIIGTGLMGTAFAEAVMKAGHEAIVYNRTTAKTAPLVAMGATAMATAAEAIMAADATILVLLDGSGVREMLLSDATKAVLRGKKLMNASTTNIDEIIEIAGEVAKCGGDLAEMTIYVGNDQLRNGQGQFVYGCAPKDESLWENILMSVGSSAFRVGEVGDATKAETPTLIASMFGAVTLAYAAAVAKKLNVPQEVYGPAISMAVPGAEYLLPKMIDRNYDESLGSVDSYTAGLTIAINTATSVGIPTDVLKDMLRLFESAASRGFGKKDGAAVLEVLLEPR
ncbi:NAD(P)-dependent oxidoreductase [Desulfovibrio sp. QI0430]